MLVEVCTHLVLLVISMVSAVAEVERYLEIDKEFTKGQSLVYFCSAVLPSYLAHLFFSDNDATNSKAETSCFMVVCPYPHLFHLPTQPS